MKWGKRIAIVLLVCAVAGIAIGVISRQQEPRYGGKRLSEWLRGTRVAWLKEVVLPEQNLHAIKQIGTNALPFLLERLKDTQPDWERNLMHKVPFLLRFAGRDSERNEEATAGFYALGEQGQGAIPELVRMIRGTNLLFRSRAILALGCIGKPVIPTLLDFLLQHRAHHINPMEFYQAWALLGTNATPAVPILIEHLDDDDQRISGSAAEFLLILAGARVETNAITQAFCKSLDSPKPKVRSAAATALGQIGDYRTGPLLQRALNDPDPLTRTAAGIALRTMQIQAASQHWGLEQTRSDQSTSNNLGNATH